MTPMPPRLTVIACLGLVLPLFTACSDNASTGITPTPYTEQTAQIDPALHDLPESDSPGKPDMNQDTPSADSTGYDPALNPDEKVRLTDAQWRAILSTAEYNVLRQSGTEYAFTGRYLNNDQKGAYYCVGCGNKLYDAEHKFHSGCGWPSFFQEIEPGSITTITDRSLGMVRTEMRCARCDGHLGHIFADAPDQPTGLRHCVNGTALLFVPEGKDIKQAFREHRAKFANQ